MKTPNTDSSQHKKPGIAIIGHVCIDRNESEHATYTAWGSTALYMAQYFIRHCGLDPVVVTRYGQDFLPYASDFWLHPSNPQEKRTQLNANVPHGKKRIFRTLYSESSGPPDIDATMRRYLGKADIVVIASLLANYPPAFVRQILQLAPPHCLKVLTLQGYLREVDKDGLVHPREFVEADQLLPLFNAVIYSTDDHPRSLALSADWAKRYPSTAFIVTDGPNGAYLVTEDTKHIPTTPVPPNEIVDSVGCGDVFDAAFIYSLHSQGDVVRAIKDAHLAARAKLFHTPTAS